MDLDHLFVFTEPGGGPLRGQLAELGLDETYTRAHPGQGTANVCYAFDNAFLELLWVTDAEEAQAPRTRRTRLWERSQWRVRSACPLGVAWRGPGVGIDTWPYRPQYLPPEQSIPVAVASDDPGLPMVFRSPGTQPPLAWPPARRRDLQRPAGFGTVHVTLHPPAPVADAPLLQALVAGGVVALGPPATAWSATLRLRGPDRPDLHLQVPHPGQAARLTPRTDRSPPRTPPR